MAEAQQSSLMRVSLWRLRHCIRSTVTLSYTRLLLQVHGEATAIARVANETSRGIGCELLRVRAERCDGYSSYPAHLVDIG